MSDPAGQALEPSVSLPTGTVTFLFTDIEGSTQRWEAHREAMQTAVAGHDALLREVITRHNGYIFKTVGDAFCTSFARVSDAIAAALDVQRALGKGDFSGIGGLKVRVALHSGETTERDGDYFGPTVNRVARLLSAGHGGQILVSGATAELAQGEMPPHTSLRDLGAHRLKDLALAEQIYQLAAPDLERDFQPLQSLDALPNNLPLQVTSFVGREQEVEELKERLKKSRLLTLAGAGGVGKTRLALQIGADLLEKYDDGVWFIELAPIPDPELIPSVVASTLNVPESQGRSLTESIVNSLRRKHALLILDNCEHLLDAAAKVIDGIMRGCQKINIIATSRQGLDISGESVHRVPSLSLPDSENSLTSDFALQHSALRLFVERAQAANDRFALTDANAATVAQICKRLDGIPLAIELAVPRLKAFSVEQLGERLSERFRILTGGSRTALPRQQTMRALIDWSYDLLSAEEKAVFRRAGVFAGGWTLEAISEVCSDANIESWALLDLLLSLVGKSLVVAEIEGSEQRYRLLESTREYALEKLTQSGESQRMKHRHSEYFLSVARKAEENWNTTPLSAWLPPLRLELDNFRAALEWALADAVNSALGRALAGELGHLWSDGSLYPEGRHWLNAALAIVGDGDSNAVAARLWLALAKLSDARPLHDAAEKARTLYMELGDRRGTAAALNLLSYGLYHLGQLEAADRASNEAFAILSESKHTKDYVDCLNRRAVVLWANGNTDEGIQSAIEGLALAKLLGDEIMWAGLQANLAEYEFSSGKLQEALAHATEAAAVSKKINDSRGMALTFGNIAGYNRKLGRMEEARAAARVSIHWARETQRPMIVAGAIQSLAIVEAEGHEPQRAARLLGYVDAAYSRFGFHREINEAQAYVEAVDTLRKSLNESLSARFAEGAAWSEDQAVEEALKA